ncbi:acyl-CoA dehydrogenase [Streptomyces aidingensis]|uniref:Butyryl-CoA dehydrogenase n=1 Tax=Streptomyces aidingensis TaxID=910347 RepID=A0A1I1MVM7_9ACTN|nr:acyl-CoA dehydrogenase [Streptomyces aidingensis]SFC89461.1 butyryl-CoA dehydrogenase [Streptomyces aidingensis]
MATPSTLLSREDLDFLLHHWLDVGGLLGRPRYAEHSRETVDAVLELSEQLATRHFAPHNKLADQNEPRMVDGRVEMIPEVGRALAAFAESGLLAAPMEPELGGARLPRVVATACFAWFQAANIGTAAYPMLTRGNAALLCAHGSRGQIDTWVRPMLAGRFYGTMCLSEPQAGSALADVATRAEPQPDGSYRLFGTKMWISGGDHELGENIVHLVLARTPGAPAGVKGLSLFLVPKYLLEPDGRTGDRNDVSLVGLNHKMGYRGTTNAVLAFGEGRHTPGGAPGAVGELVGAEHSGLACMFHMMNEARIGVGAGAAALGCTAYLKAVEYARTRLQGRPLGDKNPSGPPVPIIEHPDVRRMLLAQKAYAEGAMALILYCARLVDDKETAATAQDRQEAARLLDILTPIAKSWPSQWCLEGNHLAIQVHGGYGYTRDYDVEQHYRDNRLNPIHEGTHGIQALDLLGRRAIRDGGAALALLGDRIADTAARARKAGGDAADFARELHAAWSRVQGVTATVWADGDPARALVHATAYLEAVGHVVLAWLWLDVHLATGSADSPFHLGKRAACRYFFRHELPKAHLRFDLLESRDGTVTETDPGWL